MWDSLPLGRLLQTVSLLSDPHSPAGMQTSFSVTGGPAGSASQGEDLGLVPQAWGSRCLGLPKAAGRRRQLLAFPTLEVAPSLSQADLQLLWLCSAGRPKPQPAGREVRRPVSLLDVSGGAGPPKPPPCRSAPSGKPHAEDGQASGHSSRSLLLLGETSPQPGAPSWDLS